MGTVLPECRISGFMLHRHPKGNRGRREHNYYALNHCMTSRKVGLLNTGRIAYRCGGEEFTILLPMTTGMDGTVIAERIGTEFKKEHFFAKPRHDTHMTGSIGLAQCQPGEYMKLYADRADQLMYEARRRGMICWPGRQLFVNSKFYFHFSRRISRYC